MQREEDAGSRAFVLVGTSIPADGFVGNVEACVQLGQLSEHQAIVARLKSFPQTPGGAATIRELLAY